METHELLRAYAQEHSESAFQELVHRYVDLVYSAAIRCVDGDTQLAEDVTQEVFTNLAGKARSLPRSVMLGGWLHRHTCFVAATVMRTERRRQSRARQAFEMNALDDHSEANLAQVAPILDEVATEYSGRLKVAKLNIDENQGTPPKYGIRGIPTLMLFKNGNIEATKVGAVSKSQLTAFIDSNI